MKILVDTNVFLDFLQEREPYADYAEQIITLCATKRIEGYIAAHTIPNLFYILRNSHSVFERREMLLDICRFFVVSGIDSAKLIAALRNEDFQDFEDCLQDQCAIAVGADYIVTRNTKDFANAGTEAITPSEFIERYH
jgi:predicted nucleic acid-binding protein